MGLFLFRCLIVSTIFLGGVVCAEPAVEGDSPVRVELLSSKKTITPGESFDVAVLLDIADEWHSYWKNPGDAGIPTEVVWDLPEGFTVSDMRWPYPERFGDEFGVGFGYRGDVAFFATLTAPQDLQLGKSVNLRADVNWMACKESCVPGQSTIETWVGVDVESLSSSRWEDAIVAHAVKLPFFNTTVQMVNEGGRWFLQFERSSADAQVTGAYFFSEEQGSVDTAINQELHQMGEGYRLEFSPNPTQTLPEMLTGVLVVELGERAEAWQVIPASTVEGASSTLSSGASEAVESQGDLTFGLALIMAFFGGVILNCMPCVLPVISFKVMSFINLANEDRRKIFTHSFMFFIGVLVSFWTLAAMLLALQSYGQAIGWGFQLQEPVFVGLLALGLVVFSMSLFGVFELGTKLSAVAGTRQSRSESLAGSFLNGVLATAVATPCTGPLLGTSLGFAVTLSPPAAMLVFTMMGVGMAIPYLLLGIFPSLLRFLPKPGPWMETFKHFMGFLMIGTVLWLMWVFGGLTSTEGVLWLLGACSLAVFACWIYGRWATPLRGPLTRRLGTAVALVILSIGVMEVFTASLKLDAVQEARVVTGKWEPFSLERFEELRAEGTPVFIDFTARWCLICQTNKVVLRSDVISALFEERGVVTMVGDWTKRNPEVTEMLRKFGRNGVPLYVLYGPGDSEPVILPQVLTPELVMDSVRELPLEKKEGELVKAPRTAVSSDYSAE